MKWIKKNKLTVCVMILFLLVAILGYKVVEMFFPDERTAIYGDRLEGKVAIEKETYETMKQKISENQQVQGVTVEESGRRIDITITVIAEVSQEDAKKLVDNILEPFTESQIGYYDFQVFVKKEETELNDFPIIGYKHHNSSSFLWTRDREIIKEEESE